MNIIQSLKQNRRVVLIAFLFFLLLELFSFFYIKELKKEDLNFFNKQSVQDFDTSVNYLDNYLKELSCVLYDKTINTLQTKELMYEASKTRDKKKLALLREKLYKNNINSYEYMKTKNVRQLHFHLPHAVSFLRFHKPQKYGDSLLDVRPSLSYVNEHKTFVHIFERGSVFNGFRNVFPIFYKKEFVGTVEISYSFTAEQKEMQRANETSLVFLVNKDIVLSKGFNDGKKNYIKSEFLTLLYDKNSLAIQGKFTQKEISYINSKIAQRVEKKIERKEMFSILFQDEKINFGKTLHIDFLPIKNLYHKQVAYIVNYKISNVANLIINKYRTLFLSFSLLSLVISLSMLSIYIVMKNREEMVRKIATFDALTKIYNRYGLEEIISQKVGEVDRYKRDLSMISFDIDYFKNVNDTYGHHAGNKILKELAILVGNNVRTSDILARWGGEEFIIILPETALNNAVVLAEKLRYIIETHSFSKPNSITCSFGVTELNDGESEDELLKRVDEFLYRAKELGRNKVVSGVES